MRSYDLTPLMRSTVGFDHLSRLLDSALNTENGNSYPPYNIEKVSEDDYRITMAVAGFTPDELTVTLEDGTLTVAGRVDDVEEERVYLHRGIATRAFERRFQLAETIKVGNARFENGLLEIDLKRIIPDHKKPRSIMIETSGSKQQPRTINAA